jgi:hypothetical protein
MKKITYIISFLIALVSQLWAGEIVLDGNYQGKNLYVQNPFASSGVGFCAFEVTINGEITTDEINSSAFEIDFDNFQMPIGSPVVVKIKHKENCKPKVLNPEVLKPRSTFKTISIKVEGGSMLKWVTQEEMSKLPYTIEQYRWNKWVKAGEIEGKGSMENNEYEYKVVPHSGVNKFRVKQVDFSKEPRYSTEVQTRSDVPEVTFTLDKDMNKLSFSIETMYEIYNEYGNVVKKGYGSEVEISNLEKGTYYFNYDNKTDQFVKKK